MIRVGFVSVIWLSVEVGGLLVAQNDFDSIAYYKRATANELMSLESQSTAMRAMSKLFGGQLSRANQYLGRLSELAPEDSEVMFLKGIFHRIKNHNDESISVFKGLVAKDGGYQCCGFANASLQLGAAYAARGDLELAVDAYKQGILIDLSDTWPLIQLSQLFLEMNKPIECTEAFYGGLNGVKVEGNVDGLFVDARDIATKEEVDEWRALISIEEKLEFLRTFWKRRDPNPVDQVNERLVEHYRRLAAVRTKYRKVTSPWYDDRGRIYLRLGKPDQVCLGRPKASIKDNETWFYSSIGANVFFDFVDMNGGFELRSLLDAVDAGASMTDIVELYEERSSYNGYYSNLAMKIRTQRDVADTRADIDLRESGQDALGFSTFLALEQVARAQLSGQFMQTNDYRQDYLSKEAFANSQRFVFDMGAPHLPMNCNFSSFRSTKTASRLEFYWTIPFSQIVFSPNVSIPDKFESRLKLTLTVNDLKYNEIVSTTRDYQVAANLSETMSHFFLDQIEAELAPGRYNVAVEVRNNDKDRVGVYQFAIAVKDLSSDTLSLSDIEIAQYVDHALSKEKFMKPKTTLRVVPNPAAGILKTKPMTIYYEIYNLSLNDEGRSSYEVSYSIHMVDSDKSFFSTVTGVFGSKQASGTSSVTVKEGKSVTEYEYISFDISELPAGIARLEIKVKDLLSGKVSSSWTNVTILEKEEKEENRRLNQN